MQMIEMGSQAVVEQLMTLSGNLKFANAIPKILPVTLNKTLNLNSSISPAILVYSGSGETKESALTNTERPT